jgi:3-hydroxyisobutyrate dehydrogenase
MSAPMNVAFLGMGRMGRLMATHVLDAGHHLTVWNRTPGKAHDLVERGAREASSLEDAVSGADAIVLMLFGGDSVQEVLDPIAAAAPKGTLIIDATTTGPDAAGRLAAQAHGLGLRYVDAPVVGSLAPAKDGTLGVLVGGSADDVAEARSLIELWGDADRIRHLGDAGAGNALKATVNMCLGIAIAGVAEALKLAEDLSLDRETVLDTLEAGPFGWTIKQKRKMLSGGDYSATTFSAELMAKDLQAALGSADGPLPLAADALALAKAVVAAGRGDQDYATMAGYLADS